MTDAGRAPAQVLDDIPVDLDLDELRTQVRVEAGSDDDRALADLTGRALAVARPKALFRASFVEARTEDAVTIDGIAFTSRILRTHLDRVERVFPFIATCGAELDRLDLGGDPFALYWLDAIKAVALRAATRRLTGYLDTRFALGRTASMHPGSADRQVWPIEQQRPLFALLGEVEALIGVQLTASCLMIPNKTVSGLRFPTEVDFRSCQVCERPVCPSRAAEFDPELLARLEHGLGATR
jgi:hypothetical protein